MIEDFLRDKGVVFQVIPHDVAYTAQETAAADHVSGYKFAKTVIVTDGEKHYMLVLPAPYEVDKEQAGELIGSKVRLVSEDEMTRLFPDCELGAEPPFGSMFQMPTYVDEAQEAQKEIVFRAGSHEKTIKMAYADYVKLEKPVVGSFAVGP